jgi:enterochelin esterase-like enzyme
MSHRFRTSIAALAAFVAIPAALGAQQPGQQAASQPPVWRPPANAGTARQLADRNTPLREFIIGPQYTYAAETEVRPGIPRGRVHGFLMRSENSRIYPGVTGPYERPVAVYIPAGYVADTEAPFMVVQDGVRSYLARTVTVLDNLIHDRRIPPIIAVFIDPGPGDGPGSQRGFEYDMVNDSYVNFIETEVLPKVAADFNVRFTSDPEGRATMGGSSGAAAALTMAWFRPDLYRKVLSYSGTFVNQQRLPDSAYPRGAWEYHANLIPNNPPKPIRIWFHVSDGDNGNERAEETFGNWVLANQHMHEVLKARGYDYRYVFSLNSRHVDRQVVGQTLAGALEWLWRGYPR